MVDIDTPKARAELEAAFAAYEAALLANDIEALNRLFWQSPLTLRYGVRELQYSHAEIAAALVISSETVKSGDVSCMSQSFLDNSTARFESDRRPLAASVSNSTIGNSATIPVWTFNVEPFTSTTQARQLP